MSELSPLHAARLHEKPIVPRVLQGAVAIERGEPTGAVSDEEQVRGQFPQTFGQPQVHFSPSVDKEKASALRVGVVLSGGQAAGGHNVIAGLLDGLHQLGAKSTLLGFVGGPSGIVNNETLEITRELIAHYRNVGGFDIIGSGRTKIESQDQLESSLKTCQDLALDGLVVIGGDDSNTNAALLGEFFKSRGCKTQVTGVPKTIDGDLKNEQIEISFGHDTACRVYSEMIGNLMRDAMSARKYWHFVKLMGRSASHITLECALQTHPNITLIGEEVAAKGQTLRQITAQIADIVEQRRAAGKHYGVILIPEGLIEFIPEMGKLIGELNDLLAHGKGVEDLSQESRAAFDSLPKGIAEQLALDRDPHGNVQVSRISTEKLLIETVTEHLGGKFAAVDHFFGYEGRSAFPTHFDCNYCYALGLTSARLIGAGLTGYMAAVQNLARPVEEWSAGGVPITMMLNMERRHGKEKPVIQKALVDLEGAAFARLERNRAQWAAKDHFRFPGPIQFGGDIGVTGALPMTLALESKVLA